MASPFRTWLIFAILLGMADVPSSNADEPAAGEARLAVSVSDLRNGQGHLRLGVFDQADGFPRSRENAILWRSLPAANDVPTFELNLPPGRYAVVVLHDENDNKRHDRNWAGIPVEGYGVSNNPKPKRRAARFDEAVFTLPPEGATLNVSIQYW